MSGQFDAVVVGGGISGLVAAYRLQQRGRRIAVVDAGASPGGVIGTRTRDGFLYETGANSTLDTTPLLNALFDELGIRDERVDAAEAAKRRYIVRDGRLAALPLSPPALLRTRAFSSRAKLRLLREPFIAPAPADVDESIAAFVRRRLGGEFLDYAVDPFVSGVYAGDPERISVRAAFPRLHALEQKHGSLIRGQIAGARERRASAETSKHAARSFSFRRGMQTLPDALASRLSSYVADAETHVFERQPRAGYRLVAGGNAFAARALVLATPADVAARLLAPHADTAARELQRIEYAPVAVVATAYRRDDVAHDLSGFGFLVPRRERRRVLGTLFSSSLFAGRAPPGHVLLTTFVGGRRDPQALAADDADVARVVTHELESLLGARRPLWSEIVRWPRAIPQYEIGHGERIARIDAARAALPGLFFCGSWLGGVSVGDRVAHAHAVADAVDGFLAQPTGASAANTGSALQR